MKRGTFVWSDKWCIEDDGAWFVDAVGNELLYLNLKTNTCDFVVEIPHEGDDRFRMNPRCLRCGEEIFLFPDSGTCIFVYQLATQTLEKIEIDNPNSVRFAIYDFWRDKNNIFAVSVGLKKVLEIDIDKKKVVGYYSICENKEQSIVFSIKIENIIYSTSSVHNEIYQFDLTTKETTTYTIPEVVGGIYTLCFDGDDFWMSGCSKEIYIWNKTENSTKVIRDFPVDFGFYCPEKDEDHMWDDKTIRFSRETFTDVLAVGNYIWCIPRLSNQIIYIDKATREVRILDLAEETETWESLTQWSQFWTCKYRVEAVRENRYIIIYSVKNEYYFEIDTLNKKWKKPDYHFNDDYFNHIYADKKVLYENSYGEDGCFRARLFSQKKDQELDARFNIGGKVYNMIRAED